MAALCAAGPPVCCFGSLKASALLNLGRKHFVTLSGEGQGTDVCVKVTGSSPASIYRFSTIFFLGSLVSVLRVYINVYHDKFGQFLAVHFQINRASYQSLLTGSSSPKHLHIWWDRRLDGG